MKKVVMMLLLICLSLLTVVNVNAVAATGAPTVDDFHVYVFADESCKECDEMITYIEELKKENDHIFLEKVDVDSNKELVDKVKKSLDIKKDQLPLIVVGSNYFIGNDDDNKDNLKDAIKAYLDKEENCDIVAITRENGDVSKCLKTNEGIYEQPKSFSMMRIVLILVIVIAIAGCLLVVINNKKKKMIKA